MRDGRDGNFGEDSGCRGEVGCGCTWQEHEKSLEDEWRRDEGREMRV